METVLYIVLPAAFVLATAYLLIDKMLKNDEKRRNFELRKQNLGIVTPIRLRAYERLMLVLERTTPDTLILNNANGKMNCLELQKKLLSAVREEFSHNASQQIYVSNDLWSAIRLTQESLLQLINSCAVSCQPDEPAEILAGRIIQVYTSSGETPTEAASLLLKNEVKSLF